MIIRTHKVINKQENPKVVEQPIIKEETEKTKSYKVITPKEKAKKIFEEIEEEIFHDMIDE